ncbi:MAG: glutamate cyclase domain-containing protein [Planctomycetota bacterium]
MADRHNSLIQHFERLTRRDPAQRGLIGADGSGPGRGELVPAARLFADSHQTRGSVGILTGFFIPLHAADGHEQQAAAPKSSGATQNTAGRAETDGPPGAAVLAAVLAELGYSPRIITDEPCESVAVEAARAAGLPADVVLACPVPDDAASAWLRNFQASTWSRRMTHLVSVERVGPSHHQNSIRHNDPDAHASGTFQQAVPESAFDRCFNMRGETIDHATASLHKLFQARPEECNPGDDESGHGCESSGEQLEQPLPNTIGIGDGGNEIGMGRFAWNHLRRRIRGDAADRIPCRIATERTIVAGTSNLGAYSLAASIAVLHQRIDAIAPHSCDSQQTMLKRMVEHAGAIDGVTKVAEPTVDGVPFLTGIQPWAAIRRELGLTE